MNEQNKRRIRSQVDTNVIWNHKGISATGHSKDLSMNGVYIFSDKKPKIGAKVDLTISMANDQTTFHIEIKSEVKRHDETGFAVQFEEVDIDSFNHLKNLVAYHNDNPEDVFTEQREQPGIK